jgi:hypothetical protein
MLFNSWWHEPSNMKQSNTLQKIQYLNYITGIPVLYKILKKIYNTGTNFYTMTSFCIFIAYINTEGILFKVKITSNKMRLKQRSLNLINSGSPVLGDPTHIMLTNIYDSTPNIFTFSKI